MPIAYPTGNQQTQIFLSREEITSLSYHNIFEYPLTMSELVRWTTGKKAPLLLQKPEVGVANGFYYLGNSKGIILKRLMRKRISVRKVEIAKRAAKIISLIPSVKVVALTGALAMENATDASDVDLLIITQKGTLWTTRLLTYLVLRITNYALRKPGDKKQKDKLCLNMWLDEADLSWHPKKRNIYSAHEIVQTRPLINRDSIYEKFISENKWVKEYWPNAVRTERIADSEKRIEKNLYAITYREAPSSAYTLLPKLVEKLAFKLQYQYMKSKITNETVTPTRALFHPVDWGKYVLQKLSP